MCDSDFADTQPWSSAQKTLFVIYILRNNTFNWRLTYRRGKWKEVQFSSLNVYNHIWEQRAQKMWFRGSVIVRLLVNRMCWAYPERHEPASCKALKSINLNPASYILYCNVCTFIILLIQLIYQRLEYTLFSIKLQIRV